MHLGLGVVAGLLQPCLPQRAVGGNLEQGNEVALHILYQIVGSSCLERGDGDLGILRGGDEHHRRRIRNRHDPLERFQPVQTRHVLIERDDVDTALRQTIEPLCSATGMHDLQPKPRQTAIDQARQRLVVVDIKQRGRLSVHVAAGGI